VPATALALPTTQPHGQEVQADTEAIDESSYCIDPIRPDAGSQMKKPRPDIGQRQKCHTAKHQGFMVFHSTFENHLSFSIASLISYKIPSQDCPLDDHHGEADN
jgi:hypothetical protein